MSNTTEKTVMVQNAEEGEMANLIEQGMADLITETEPVKLEVQNVLTLIPAESQCIEDIPEELQAVVEQGYFSPVSGSAHIVNRLNGRLHAYIQVDKKGSRTIVFHQQYDDGSYSAEFPIKQEDLLMVVTNTNSKDSSLVKEANASRKRIMRGYLGRCDGRETLNMSQVMRVLVEALGQLPIKSDYEDELSKMELYKKVLEGIQGHIYTKRRKGYFSLEEGAIENAARELGMTSRQLLARLKREGFLYLSESCKGYQAKVPTCRNADGTIDYDWRYCLVDLEYFARLKNPEKYGPADELAEPLETISAGWGC